MPCSRATIIGLSLAQRLRRATDVTPAGLRATFLEYSAGHGRPAFPAEELLTAALTTTPSAAPDAIRQLGNPITVSTGGAGTGRRCTLDPIDSNRGCRDDRRSRQIETEEPNGGL